MDRAAHWEGVYRAKGDRELSWHQDRPVVSLTLIDAIRPRPQRAIDVGGGQSAMAGALLERGVERVTVLEISPAAVERARARLGPAAGGVRWVVGDVLAPPEGLGEFDLWHDRAVFHFLTEAEERERYIASAGAAVRPGGHAVVAAFAPSGPERCSGLPVCRYDAAGIAGAFAPAFELVASASETHMTPWGKPQDFAYAVLRRVSAAGSSQEA